MEPDLRKRLILTGIAFVILVGARVGWMVYERRDTGAAPVRKETYVANQDDLVPQHKIFAYDVKSAKKELADKPMWVRSGNQIPYYHYNAAAHSVNFQKKAGMLAPIEKLTVEDIILQKAPVKLASGQVAVSQKDVVAVFKREGDAASYAFTIGTNVGDDYTLMINEILLSQDPHEMYKHWPAETWSAIERHEVKEGMNELQAEFAVGTDMSVGPGDYGNRVVEFGNLGKPVQVTFAKNKAVKIVKAP
ncbi:MAG: hypothetical protein LAP21_15945 [Acidobacteriia bacterium]|nr:hypothetical protein [Terriglobia bacterium]